MNEQFLQFVRDWGWAGVPTMVALYVVKKFLWWAFTPVEHDVSEMNAPYRRALKLLQEGEWSLGGCGVRRGDVGVTEWGRLLVYTGTNSYVEMPAEHWERQMLVDAYKIVVKKIKDRAYEAAAYKII